MGIRMKCRVCGGTCDFKLGEGYECEYCHEKYSGAEISDTVIGNLNIANEKRIENYDFDGALQLCENILKEEPENQEALWCALLAEYQVAYVKDKKDKYIATFMNPEIGSLKDSKYYEKLNNYYKSIADEIEKVRKRVCAQAENFPNYSIFISYKSGTNDEIFAETLYNELNKSGKYSVFFAKESIHTGDNYEAHIYTALRSADVLVLLGSSEKYVESKWVANEWKRFLAYGDMGMQKSIVFAVAKNVSLENIKLQAMKILPVSQNDSDKNWLNKIIEEIDRAFKSFQDVDDLIDKAKNAIRGKHFHRAKKLYNEIKIVQPKNALAHWGLLKCKLKAFDDYDIVVKCKGKGLTQYAEYNEALKCCTDEQKKRFKAVNTSCINGEKDAYKQTRDNYNYYIAHSKVQRAFKKVAVIVSALLIFGFGVYSVIGITNPVRYTIEGSEATLSGKSIYFNLVVKDLEVDTYKAYPVVKIGDGVFKGSKLKTVTLSDSVTEIGEGAFENSKDLTTVTIENCTYIGANAFSGCTSLTEIKIGASDTTVISENAFANVNKKITISVPTVSEKAIDRLKAAYPNLNIEVYTQDKVQECIYFISKLNSLTYDSEAAIQKAENLYNALSAEEKAKIIDYSILKNARSAYNTVVAINEIGVITLDSNKAITNAENLYAALTTEQKQTVSNYSTLTTARAVYNTMSQIAEIGKVQINSESKIIKAEEAYNTLTYEQRELVTNYSTLTSAREKIDTLLVNEVIAKITAIGTVITLDSEYLIAVSEEAYNNLTQGQQEKVSNYNTLTDARAVYNVIAAIDKIGEVTVSSQNSISIAQSLYDELTSVQKLKVTNYNELTDAVAVYPVVLSISAFNRVVVSDLAKIESAELNYAALSTVQKAKVNNYTMLTDARAAYNTVVLIDNIGEITETSYDKIKSAQNSYDNLTSVQQSIVGNYDKLSSASPIFEVIVKIRDIGTVTLNSSSDISSAESAYNSLSSTQKQSVFNYSVLTTARAIYNLESVIGKLGTLALGRETNYNYKTLNTGNMVTELNNESTRSAADSVTRTGFNLFTEDEVKAFSEVFPNFYICRYDLSSSRVNSVTYTVPKTCTSIGIIGNTTYTYSGSQIKIASRSSDILLELCNFNIISASGKPAIDASELPSQYTVSLNFVGSCNIAGKSGDDGAKATVSYDINSGATSTKSGGEGDDGNDGTSAIVGNVFNVNVNPSAKVNISGGAGGAGGDGGDGAGGINMSGRGQCGHGGAGGIGGNGATAFEAQIISVANNGTLDIQGGAGGAGGAGGHGGNNQEATLTDRAEFGGKGGVGGAGGHGGLGINVKGNSITINGNKVTVKGGDGGAGGVGGAGGNGGKTGGQTTGSKGGDGGAGGAGGDGASPVNNACNNANLTAGMGGKLGTGGAGGGSSPGNAEHGKPGDDGKKGADGAI